MKKFLVLTVLLAVCCCQAQNYAQTLKDIRQAFDSNKHKALYQKYWKAYQAKPTPQSAFAAGTIRFFWLQLNSLGYKEIPPDRPINEPERMALHYAVENEKRSGYPLALYAWYLGVYGDPSLPPPPRKFLRMIDVKDAQGKVLRQAPLYERESRYLALEKRQDELIERAFKIEPDNPLVVLARRKRPLRENVRDAKTVASLAALLPDGRGTVWEFALLHGLYVSRQDGNAGVPSNLNQSIADALERSKNGPFAVAYSFLKKS